MTLLIIFLSVTNIALGYGLAIYLGHARVPWAPGKMTTNYRPPAFREKSRESEDDHTGTIDQADDENHVEVAAETAASETVTEEELAEGIDAFQEQLKERQEHSKLHAVSGASKE